MMKKRRQKFVYSTASGHQNSGNSTPPLLSVQDMPNKQFSGGQTTVRNQGLSVSGKAQYQVPDHGLSTSKKRKTLPDVASRAKMQKTSNEIDNFDDEVDDLDLLGTAALEQYELTQKETVTPDSNLTSQYPQIPKSHFISATNAPSPSEVKEKETLAAEKSNHLSGQSDEHSHITSEHQQGLPSKETTDNELEGKIKLLLEQNYSKDGEVKVLRGEKERLLGELRKKEEQVRQKEEQMHQMQTALLSERQNKEHLLTREMNSLATRLQFKEQEVLTLQEKCAMMEKRYQDPGSRFVSPTWNQTRTQHASSTSVSTKEKTCLHTPLRDKPTEFISTETFMPLSQLNTGEGCITPVHIGSVRPQGHTDHHVSKKGGKAKKTTRSRSISPNPSNLKKLKYRSKSDKDNATSSRERLHPDSNTLHVSESIPSAAEERSPDKTAKSPLVLHVPGRGIDGAQILMLLVKQNLLKPPSFLRHADEQVQGSANSTASYAESHLLDQIEGDKVTGLLSLLNLGQKQSVSFNHCLHSTPAIGHSSDSSFQRQSSDSGSSSLTTPTRHSRLLPTKPHTLARTNISQLRLRSSSGLLTATKKANSTANTPVKVSISNPTTSSLLSSIDAGSLHRNIGNLLVSSELATFSKKKRDTLLSLNSSFQSDSSYDSVIDILKQVGKLITNYHKVQLKKVRASSNLCSHLSYDSSESTDASLLYSPRSSSTASSRNISDLTSPPLGDQQLFTQALEILETLVSYSRQVREQVLLQPPEFVIDSRPSSSLDTHQNPPSLNLSLEGTSVDEKMTVERSLKGTNTLSNLVEASHKLEVLQKQETKPNLSPSQPRPQSVIAQWKGNKLCRVKNPSLILSDNVWTSYEDKGHSVSAVQPSQPVKGSGCGQLFPVLLELPVPPWRESQENILTCFKILTTLAEGCPVGLMHRFGVLFQKEIIAISLEKEEPHLTSSVLSLLTFLVRSEDIVELLCRHGDPCILLICYQCLLEPPSGEKELTCKIQVQIVRLISQIAVSPKGSFALFEKCSCSHELLKTLVSLLNKLVDCVYRVTQWSQRQLGLAREVIALVYRISINDHYFDSHRDQCEHTYTFVFNRLGILLKSSSQPFQEVSMVSELLSYCEDSEDSHEASEDYKMCA